MKLGDLDAIAIVRSLSEASTRLGNFAPIGKSPEFEIYMAQARALGALAEALLAGMKAANEKDSSSVKTS